jgi:23S rRNA pseudouridine1911/1915/1917 synthase
MVALDNDKNNYPEYIEKVFRFQISSGQTPERIDIFLANNIRNATRTKVQKAIEEGFVSINGKPTKSNKKLFPGNIVECKLYKPPPIELVPENIPLNILFEDDLLIVVNKPAGMVTHPAFGNRYGTLVNAVLYHLGFRESIQIEAIADDDDSLDEGLIFDSDAIRPGVVHRLDKDTTGLLVVSKNPVVHAFLADQFFHRTVTRFYYALVWGKFSDDHGVIEGNIGRSPRDRKLFAIVKKDGKPAKTEYWVLDRFEYMTLLKIKLWTGRTHQIRVHLSSNNHPVVGDVSYGGNIIKYGGQDKQFYSKAINILDHIKRQMLHAKVLGFMHPSTKEPIIFESELPDDFDNLLKIIRL